MAVNSHANEPRSLNGKFRNLARNVILIGFLGLDVILVRNTLIDMTSGSYFADTLFVETNIVVTFSICALALLYFKRASLGKWTTLLWVLLVLPAFVVAYIKLQTLGIL
jgi:hypothetical protein